MPEQTPITVAVGRFDDLIARGLRSLIEGDQTLQLVAVDIAADRLRVVLQAHHPRVVIVDTEALRSPVDVRELTSRHPATRLLLLASHPTTVESAQLLAFGAAACLSKTTQSRDILNAVHLASRGLQLAPRDVHHTPANGSGLLTARESDVLAQLHRRSSNAQIAANLHISVETVRTHARHIYRKLGVASRRELLAPMGPEAREERTASGQRPRR